LVLKISNDAIVGGQYEAEINKEGSELNGTWTQGGNGLPLKLTGAARQDKGPAAISD
jgi:hypothetical protein